MTWQRHRIDRVGLVLAVAFGACLWGSAAGDVITLKSGRTIRGKIIERRPTEIVLEVSSGEVVLKHSQITSITRESDFDRLVGEGNDLAAGGLYEKAIERYRLALVRRPDEKDLRARIVTTYHNLAAKRLQARDVAGAERALTDLLRFAPDDEAATKSLARIRQRRAQVETIIDRAGLLFDIGAYGEAARQYERALALAPGRAGALKPLLRRAYVEYGNTFFVQQHYPEAAVFFLKANRTTDDPDREVRKRWAYSVLVPVINQINSGTMRDVAAWQGAAATAERVARQAPDVPHVQFVLGLCHEALGEPTEAVAAYANVTGEAVSGPVTPEGAKTARNKAHRTLRADPVRVVVATKDQRWLKVEHAEWQTITTDHFVIFHRNAYIAQKVARAAEYWYAAIVVHWTAPGTYARWTRKCSLYLYPTREAFQAALKQPAWVPALSQLLAREGALVEHRLSTYQTVRLLNESILPHELTHIIFPQLIGYPGTAGGAAEDGLKALPRWIHECTALLEEPAFKRYRFRMACRTYLKDGVALSLARVMAIGEHPKDDEAQRFYAQCHAIAEFLMTKGGRKAFLKFALATVRDGAEKALLDTYGFESLEAFDRAWRVHASRA